MTCHMTDTMVAVPFNAFLDESVCFFERVQRRNVKDLNLLLSAIPDNKNLKHECLHMDSDPYKGMYSNCYKIKKSV